MNVLLSVLMAWLFNVNFIQFDIDNSSPFNGCFHYFDDFVKRSQFFTLNKCKPVLS